jgi:hypothetical protein
LNADYYGLVEMVFSLGVVIGLALWELRSVQRSKKKTGDPPPSEEGE